MKFVIDEKHLYPQSLSAPYSPGFNLSLLEITYGISIDNECSKIPWRVTLPDSLVVRFYWTKAKFNFPLHKYAYCTLNTSSNLSVCFKCPLYEQALACACRQLPNHRAVWRLPIFQAVLRLVNGRPAEAKVCSCRSPLVVLFEKWFSEILVSGW